MLIMESLNYAASVRVPRYICVALLLTASAANAQTRIACPVMMFDGSSDLSGGLGLTFMNTGKVPIQHLELYCAPLNGKTTRRSLCHTETGIFYPGTPYPIRFAYSSKAAFPIRISLKTIRLYDGYEWTPAHGQSCHSLTITKRRKR